MAPPAWLVQRWKEQPNWVKRFVQGSYELNAILCGVPIDKSATIWKPAAVREFLAHMKKVQQIATKPMILYRGTQVQSPTMSPAALTISSCQFMSTSKSQAIAKEFAGRNGYIQEFHVGKGVAYYDLEELYGDDPVKREKEVLLYPGCTLELVSFNKNKLVWNITPKAA